MDPKLIEAINALTSAIETQNGIAEALVVFTDLLDKEIKKNRDLIEKLRRDNNLFEL